MMTFVLRQAAYAFSLVAGLLLLAEILLPGSVLPFFNLHALVFVVLALHVITLGIHVPHHASRITHRLMILIPIATLVCVTVILTVWGGSASAMLLFASLITILVGFSIAIATS